MNTGVFRSEVIFHGYEEIGPYFVLVRPEDSGEEVYYCKRITGLRRAIENLDPGDESKIENKHRNAEGKSFKGNLPACVGNRKYTFKIAGKCGHLDRIDCANQHNKIYLLAAQ